MPEIRYEIQQKGAGGIYLPVKNGLYADGKEVQAIDKAHSLGPDFRVIDRKTGKIIYPKIGRPQNAGAEGRLKIT